MSFPMNVVNPRLAAGRGEDFSASKQNEKLQEEYELDGSRKMPINQRIEDSLDTEGLVMASTDAAIPQENLGFQMLQKMGWKGQGLGSNEDGIKEPVGGGAEAGIRLGLGKQEQDKFYTAADNIQRKRLETELQANEDDSRAAMREVETERGQKIKEDVTLIKRTFFCEVCHKQYANAAEMEVHLSSYDHNHKKRLVELRNAENERTKKGRDKREKRRQEKELLRLNTQIQKARRAPADLPEPSQAPPPSLGGPEPPPPPPPPPPGSGNAQDIGSAAEIASSRSLAVEPSREAVQFNMGATHSQKQSAAKRLQLGSRIYIKPRQKVAGFSADSDDDGEQNSKLNATL